MSPENRPFPWSEKDKEDTETKPRRFRFGILDKGEAAAQKNAEEAEEPKPKSINEKLVESVMKKAEANAEADDAAKATKESKEEANHEAGDEAAGETTEKSSGQTEEQRSKESSVEAGPTPESQDVPAGEEKVLPPQERRPNQISIGEGLIELQGDAPLEERVISLHGERVPEVTLQETEEQLEHFKVQHPESTPQHEQQHQAAEAPVRESVLSAVKPLPAELFIAEATEAAPIREPETNIMAIEQPEMQAPASLEALQPLRLSDTAEAGGPAASGAPSAVPSERLATKEDLDDALHRSAKIHEQRGVLSGLLLGSYFANRRLRRRQIEESKELKRQAKHLEDLQKQFKVESAEQTSQHSKAEQRFNTVEKRFENPSRPEKLGKPEKPERVAVRPEVGQPDPNEQLAIPQDHRLETSAWHSIEVDNKTGKPVEAPAFQYGHEYYRERAHENGPANQRHAATGEVALVAAAQAGQNGGTPGSSQPQQPASRSNGTNQGVLGTVVRQAEPAKSGNSTGPIWPWIVALITIVVCLVALIH